MLTTVVFPAPEGPNNAVTPPAASKRTASLNAPSSFSTSTASTIIPVEAHAGAAGEPFRGEERRKRQDDREQHQPACRGVAAGNLHQGVDRGEMVCVSPGILDTKVMVAPNSPSARAKHSTTPAMMPGKASGKVTVRNTRTVGAERGGGLLEPAVDRLKRKPDRADHERKAHDAAGQRRAGPAEREHDAEMIVQKGADRPLASERNEQQIPGDDRRQHQRQEDEPVEHALAPEILARQQPADGDAERQRERRRDERDAQRQRDGGPFGGGEVKHGVPA